MASSSSREAECEGGAGVRVTVSACRGWLCRGISFILRTRRRRRKNLPPRTVEGAPYEQPEPYCAGCRVRAGPQIETRALCRGESSPRSSFVSGMTREERSKKKARDRSSARSEKFRQFVVVRASRRGDFPHTGVG